MSSLAARALDADHANFRLGNESFQMAGATFVRNTATPSVYDTNHVAAISARTPSEIEELFAAVEREYQHANHRRYRTDFRTPPEFIARLHLDGGYERQDSLFLLLEGGLIGSAPPCDLRPLASEADWEAFWGLMWEDWSEHHARLNQPAEESVARQMLTAKRAKQPPVQYWLSYVEDRAVAYFNSWEGPDGVGQVEDLFVTAKSRKRGVATALIHHCVAQARAKGAGPVVIVADSADTPKNIYARMGFRPVAVSSNYHKKLA